MRCSMIVRHPRDGIEPLFRADPSATPRRVAVRLRPPCASSSLDTLPDADLRGV